VERGEDRGDPQRSQRTDDDNVLVDRSVRVPFDDGIYVFEYDGGLLVKRVRIDPVRKKLAITSDNPAYPRIADLDPSEVASRGG
jgi:phage repressor protein C with HTH and peptisase S24 domain